MVKTLTQCVSKKGLLRLYRDNVSKSHYVICMGSRFCADVYAESLERARELFRQWRAI